MAQYFDRINRLASMAGFTVNPLERASLTILEDEIANLTVDNAAKQLQLVTVNDELDKVKLEIKALEEEEKRLDNDIKEELHNNHSRVDILRAYTDTIESKEDFLANKIVKEIEDHNKTFYDLLKEVHDKASEVSQEFEQMRALQAECDQLRQKAVQ